MPKKKRYYKEIALPLRKIINIGNGKGIVIPSSILKKYNLKLGDGVIPIFLIRQKMVSDEIKMISESKEEKEISLEAKSLAEELGID